jgi:DNA-binding transcriptional MerR regulator
VNRLERRAGTETTNPEDLDSLAFIKWCQPLGATSKEVRQLLPLPAAVARLPAGSRGRKPKELESIVRMGEEKLASIEEKVTVGRKTGLSGYLRPPVVPTPRFA